MTVLVEEIKTGRMKLMFHTAWKKATPTLYDSEESSALRPKRAGVGSTEDSLLEKKGVKQGGRGDFSPDSNVISLTQNADLSTFSHELAHCYLSNLLELSKLGRTSASLHEDA